MRLAGPETYGDCRRRGSSGGREREYVELPRSSHHPGTQKSAPKRIFPRGGSREQCLTILQKRFQLKLLSSRDKYPLFSI